MAARAQLRSLEQRLGVRFRDRSLLGIALTHRSVLNEQPESGLHDNERLEFLGDAVLGAVVGEQLYRMFPEAPEGSLTILRAELVQRLALAEWARRFDLGPSLLLGRGEEQRGGRERASLLASTFEAVIGAIHMDRGYDAVRRVVEPLVADALAGADAGRIVPPSRARDPKSELQYRIQAGTGDLPTYRVVSMEGPEHRPVFTVEVQAGGNSAVGVGRSKQDAEQDAARRALELLPEA
ncbi:MAG: ribonuclease III [Chloroflexi bacterium]|nr:ribonuclease III [Chloroflexota bacterium]